MSFRELRDFTEIMRSLGYPRIISVENFRTPNFALVADALYWMIHKYDPNVIISDEITTQDDRVNFISRVVKVLAGKARLKLNAKRLYAADGKAVRELLKVARLLYIAQKETSQMIRERRKSKGEQHAKAVGNWDGTAIPAMSNIKALANEITESGAKLFELLQFEDDLRGKRENALRFLDATQGTKGASENEFLERKVQDLIAAQEENIAAMKKQCADLEHDEKSLVKKIKRKKAEMERSEKRLSSLQKVRPAFMDEIDKLEEEMKKNYTIYLERYRNLQYLEKQLDAYNAKEKEKLESSKRHLKRLQDRLRKRGERLDKGTKAIEMAFDEHTRGEKRPMASNGRRHQGRRNGNADDDESLSGHSSDTPSIDSDDDSGSSATSGSVRLSSSGDDDSDSDGSAASRGGRGDPRRDELGARSPRGDSPTSDLEGLSGSGLSDDGESSDDDF
eukprot:g4082.t1